MGTRQRVLLTAAVTVPMVLGAAGVAYAAHYQERALPGSAIAGVSVAGMSRADVAGALRERAADLTVVVNADGVTRTAHLSDLGYTVDVDATLDAVFAPNKTWSSYATSLISSHDVPAAVSADAAKVEQVTTELVERTDKVGRNASVALDADKKSFVVTPAVAGHTVAPESFQDVVEAAARALSPATADVTFVETEPSVTTASAEKVATQANALVSRKLAVSDGSQKHRPSTRLRASWVSIPTADGSLGSPSLDARKVQSWVASLAKDATIESRPGLRNVSAAGTVISVVDQARDGRVVSNADVVSKAAAAALSSGKAYSGDFDFTKVAATWKQRTVAVGAEKLAYPAAEGEKWVDVNLSNHTMTAYVGGRSVLGPIKMVDGQKEKPTVVGTFKVYLKNSKMTMRGNNADGTNYETPDVPWVSFFHQGFALHGAPWRSSFGYSGSHGCINLPVDVAKTMYDFAPIGTPVTTHF